jgi:hypothetical protein
MRAHALFLSAALRCAFALLACCFASLTHADVFRPAYLELREAGQDASGAVLYDVMWKRPAVGDSRLAIQIRFPQSTMQVTAPQGIFSENAYIERWRISRPGGLTGQTLSIDGIVGGVTDVMVRIERQDGTSQVERLLPQSPQFTVKAATGTAEVAWSYLVLGVEHILGGIDHLLFVLALLLIVRGGKRILMTITAFTVAHSITLMSATLGWMHVPGPPVEAMIALSIVFVASEIVHGLRGRPGLTARAPWIVAFSFGLLHGFGFCRCSCPGWPAAEGRAARAVDVQRRRRSRSVDVRGICPGVRRRMSRLPVPDTSVDVVTQRPTPLAAWQCFWVVERVAAFF